MRYCFGPLKDVLYLPGGWITVRLDHYSRDGRLYRGVYTRMIYVYRTQLAIGERRVWLDRLAPPTLTAFSRGHVNMSRESVCRELIQVDTQYVRQRYGRKRIHHRLFSMKMSSINNNQVEHNVLAQCTLTWVIITMRILETGFGKTKNDFENLQFSYAF